MRKLIVNKRFIIVFLVLIITSLAYGQDGNSRTGGELSGKGTEYSPYIINSTADWEKFANESNAATYWASGVYVRMDASISVTSSVGTDANPYKGNFDGNWNTLDVTLTGEKADYVAPFSYVESATIKNLTVSGKIINYGSYIGGLIGYTKSGTTTVTSCTSSVTISSGKNGQGYDGGFVGHIIGESSKVEFKYCIFNGTISGENLRDCAGFVGSIDKGGYAKYEYCTMAYKGISISSGFYTFHHNNGGDYESKNSYYAIKGSESDNQGGTQALTSHLVANTIYKKYTYTSKATTTTYYVPSVDIDELSADILYGGSVNPIVSYYGRPLVKGTDYSLDVKRAKGDVIITGKTDYYGTYSISGITVQDISTWRNLNTLLQNSSKMSV